MLREKLYRIVFESDTKAGRRFDAILLFIIVLSVSAVMLESIPRFGERYAVAFFRIELFFTVLFTIEYLTRIWISPKPAKYIFSFWGLIDFLSIIPTLLILLYPGIHFFMTIRSIRLLRIFRIAKMVRFVSEAQLLMTSIRSGIYKISTFFFTVLIIVVIMGTIMYVVEGQENGFTSIPQSIYWAIITITTVGYGDIVPHTILGKLVSSVVMIIGYAIIAVPTGIFTVEMVKATRNSKVCKHCSHANEKIAHYCNQCGEALD